MSHSIESIAGFISISACSWLLLAVFISIRIQLFIVKRYEHETDLLNTIWFKEHATFTRMLPNFLSSSLYISHLLSVVWLWNVCRSKKPFRDIESPEEITRHFTKKEVRRVKWFAYISLVLVGHAITGYVISLIWPGAFD